MLFSRCLGALALLTFANARAPPIDFRDRISRDSDGLQNIVTWDERSLLIRGERVMLWSGEFHPFRLPVPGLWLDVFQKIKAMGYNCVSFYVNWSLLEGQEGVYRGDGVFALEPFFKAASTAGIYLLARPGPYINAEVSGGGFPGWLSRNPAFYRTRDQRYLDATSNYIAKVTASIAKAQITNGGPVILLQPENEYTVANMQNDPEFPDAVYFQAVMDQYRKGGIVVPFISNDAYPAGYFAPGPPKKDAAVNIYGHDGYPLGFDCSNPTSWPSNGLPQNYWPTHLNQSSSTPYSIVEFQGGSFDSWSGAGFDKCAELLGPEFEKVFYKNNIASGVTIHNLYMTYGGTNWCNQAVPGTYTSYDYGAAISEDRTVDRVKFGEAKLIGNWVQSSAPQFLEAVSQYTYNPQGAFTGNMDIAVEQVKGNKTSFFIVRHSQYDSTTSTPFKATLPTSRGNITIPQLGGQLSLDGRDSKIMVTDYDLAGLNLLYCSADIFTWKKYGNKRVLVVYGDVGQTHELAISNGGVASPAANVVVRLQNTNQVSVVNFDITEERQTIQTESGLVIYVLSRSDAYDYWVVDLADDSVSGNYTNYAHAMSAPIVKAGYLVRSVQVLGGSLAITGDVNATTPLEIIGGAPMPLRELTFNGRRVEFSQAKDGTVQASVVYQEPQLSLPDLSNIQWRSLDTLPEIESGYDDSKWTKALLTTSNRTSIQPLITPRSLFAGDYGYHYGDLLFRGHFTATGNESTFYLQTIGGDAYGWALWLNDQHLSSYAGTPSDDRSNTTVTLPKLSKGKKYTFTVVLNTMSLEENYDPGENDFQSPRGILDYDLKGQSKSAISWVLTGNLGGENYIDKTRGPLNEGGLFAERNGYHLPGAPTSSWSKDFAGPLKGTSNPGIAFYTTEINLNIPRGYDVPLSVVFEDDSNSNYRCQIWVNGYQFGKYINNLGPQKAFPVPEGIWNYRGKNTLAISLFSFDERGNRVEGLKLQPGLVSATGYGPVALSPMTGWQKRVDAY